VKFNKELQNPANKASYKASVAELEILFDETDPNTKMKGVTDKITVPRWLQATDEKKFTKTKKGAVFWPRERLVFWKVEFDESELKLYPGEDEKGLLRDAHYGCPSGCSEFSEADIKRLRRVYESFAVNCLLGGLGLACTTIHFTLLVVGCPTTQVQFETACCFSKHSYGEQQAF
jgi:hypothetical protein